jgi:hypothetical protein
MINKIEHWFMRTFGKAQSDSSPTLDKIDNAKGYTKGNIIWVSSRANRIKSDATLDELEKLIEYVKQNS